MGRRLSERVQMARQALGPLRELVGRPKVTAIERGAAIQRFEYSFETAWKAAQLWLREEAGLDYGSPKEVVRGSFAARLLDENDSEGALGMADDRNLTVHTYDEALARVIFGRLEGHADLLGRWVEAVASRIHA